MVHKHFLLLVYPWNYCSPHQRAAIGRGQAKFCPWAFQFQESPVTLLCIKMVLKTWKSLSVILHQWSIHFSVANGSNAVDSRIHVAVLDGQLIDTYLSLTLLPLTTLAPEPRVRYPSMQLEFTLATVCTTYFAWRVGPKPRLLHVARAVVARWRNNVTTGSWNFQCELRTFGTSLLSY